ncbi:MAG: selenite/tellurite reduction operon b-type cytochrome iron-sulfur cluster-binding subunit ExtO [Deferribacterota bacterium]|nr:selenite/tellurite reduction operon b-type cytochrome iron-sulfur cluster-binding subunit ExtO [Deferribacterota bacterium]
MRIKLTIIGLLTVLSAIIVTSTLLAKDCQKCHGNIKNLGKHRLINCKECHIYEENHYKIDRQSFDYDICLKCHNKYKKIKDSLMVNRKKEKDIINHTFNEVDNNFYNKNCKKNCHISHCFDCHIFNKKIHDIGLPTNEKCVKCHRGYFVGIDYLGLAIREDHERYKRGIKKDGLYYLKMLPDVHYEKNIECHQCHSMESFIKEKKYSKDCRDCHKKIDKTIVEHSINEHMEKMECYACHSAWTVNELGTFYIQFINSSVKKYYNSLNNISNEYVKSSFLKDYYNLFLGLNSKGKYSPIRPEFIFFYTKIVNNTLIGDDNRLLGSYWKAFFPHTVRREVVLCDECHRNKKKYLLLEKEKRVYELKKDDIKIDSFFSQKDQQIINGVFIDNNTYNQKIGVKNKYFINKYIEKWKKVEKFIESLKETY